MSPEQFLEAVLRHRAIAIFRGQHQGRAAAAMDAAVAAGFRMVEFTVSTPGVYELIAEFAEMGFLGAPLTGYGCAGMNPVAYGLTMIELERQDSGIRSFCSVQSALAMYPIHAFGSEEQRERFLPGMARGQIIGAFGLTEPNSGSDPGSMRTHARQQGPGGDYILSGQKFWITNSPIADVMVVWAKTLDHGSDTPVIRGFLVERGMPGLQTPETHGKLSLRASITGEIVLDEVKVPKANLLPGVHGLKGPLSCLTQARYGIGWGAVGAAMGVYERARRYTLERVQFGKPLAGFQLTQQKLVELHNEIGKALLLAFHFGRLKQDGKLTPESELTGLFEESAEAIDVDGVRVEARLAFSVSQSQEEKASASLRVGSPFSMVAAQVNASYTNKYSFNADGSSSVSTRFVSIPPPAELKEILASMRK